MARIFSILRSIHCIAALTWKKVVWEKSNLWQSVRVIVLQRTLGRSLKLLSMVIDSFTTAAAAPNSQRSYEYLIYVTHLGKFERQLDKTINSFTSISFVRRTYLPKTLRYYKTSIDESTLWLQQSAL